MKHLVILILFFISMSLELNAQKKKFFEYEKKMGNLIFNLTRETSRGPLVLTLSNEVTHKIDTVGYVASIAPTENIIFDTYFTEDYFMCIGEIKGYSLTAEEIKKERGVWVYNPWGLQILTREEMKLPHDIRIIDKDTLKVTKNGRNYLYKLDFANRRVDITEQN